VPADTEYADMRAAYDALSAEMKARCEGLRVHHSIAYSRQTLGFDFSESEQDALKGAIHPLIRTIPRSNRRSLYVASHASRIIDWPVPEGRLLLRELIEHATQRPFVYRHQWREGDLVIWDNRATMHRAMPFDDTRYKREHHPRHSPACRRHLQGLRIRGRGAPSLPAKSSPVGVEIP